MTNTNEHTRSMYLYGLNGLLSTLRRRFFKDSKSNYGIAEEKKEICMVIEMCGNISKLKDLLTT
jgi:hypothetical protein